MQPIRTINKTLLVWGRERNGQEYNPLDEQIRHVLALGRTGSPRDRLREALDTAATGYVTRRMYAIAPTTFRARLLSDDAKVPIYEHLDELVAPPKDKVRIGRFNSKGHRVRYFASDPHTALMEMRPLPFSRFVLLASSNVGKKGTPYIPFGLQKIAKIGNIKRLSQGNILDGLEHEEIVSRYLMTNGIYEYWLNQERLFGALATKLFDESTKDHWYELTSCFGENLMQADGVRGIFYPTVQNNGRGVNIAMPEKWASKLMKPLEAWLVHFGQRIDPPGKGGARLADYSVVRRGGFDRDGNISWGSYGNWDANHLHLEISPIDADGRFKRAITQAQPTIFRRTNTGDIR